MPAYIKALSCLSQRCTDSGNIREGRQALSCLFKRCTDSGNIQEGRLLCHLAVESGIYSDAYVGNFAIRMFTAYGCLPEANKVFSQIAGPDVYSWSAILSACVRHGQNEQAIWLYECMQKANIKPDGHAYVAALKACANSASLVHGELVHAHIISSQYTSDVHISSTLIDMYAKCGKLETAQSIFDGLSEHDLVTWNALLSGYISLEHWQEALQLFQEMQGTSFEPNPITLVCATKACANMGFSGQGKICHGLVIENSFEVNLILSNALIDMYAKCGCLDDVVVLFDKVSNRNVVTWTAVIAGYSEHGYAQEALETFEKMEADGFNPNEITYVSTLKACSQPAFLIHGMTLHSKIISSCVESIKVVNSALISMYLNCGSLIDATSVFHQSVMQDMVTWNAIITGFVQYGHAQEAFQLFAQMQQEAIQADCGTLVSILKACADTVRLDACRLMHVHILETGLSLDISVGNTLIHTYAHCGSLKEAHRAFGKMPEHNVVSWNAIIAGYTHYRQTTEALQHFQKMIQNGVKPNQVTYVCILKACYDAAALCEGNLIYVHIVKSGFELDVYLGSVLLGLYIRCGNFKDAHQVFDRLQNQSVVSWSALIAGYAHHNNYYMASKIFEGMQLGGVRPDDVAYLSLLSACSHVGLLDEGHDHFKQMLEEHRITPRIKHFNCMVDLLSRMGHFTEAETLVKSMPYQANKISQTSLLCHCKTYGLAKLGRQCLNFDNS